MPSGPRRLSSSFTGLHLLPNISDRPSPLQSRHGSVDTSPRWAFLYHRGLRESSSVSIVLGSVLYPGFVVSLWQTLSLVDAVPLPPILRGLAVVASADTWLSLSLRTSHPAFPLLPFPVRDVAVLALADTWSPLILEVFRPLYSHAAQPYPRPCCGCFGRPLAIVESSKLSSLLYLPLIISGTSMSSLWQTLGRR